MDKPGLKVGGYNTEPDYSKLGTALLIGACMILAVRTARWPVRSPGSTTSDMDLQAEVENAILLAERLMSHVVGRKPNLFPSKQMPWYVATDEDAPR